MKPEITWDRRTRGRCVSRLRTAGQLGNSIHQYGVGMCVTVYTKKYRSNLCPAVHVVTKNLTPDYRKLQQLCLKTERNRRRTSAGAGIDFRNTAYLSANYQLTRAVSADFSFQLNRSF